MATITANITWTPVPGSFGTTIEYRKESESSWTKPTSPANPTLLNTYPIDIEVGVYYYIRLSTSGGSCGTSYRIKKIIYSGGTCCPVGYTLSPDGTYCYYIDEVAATAPTLPETSVAAQNVAYSICGSYIYAAGYNVDGTGTSSQINPSNPFWANGGGICVAGTTSDGPLNRTGLWATTTTDNQDVGFAICLNLPSSKTYYIGMGMDNYGIVKIDGVTIIQQDATALGTQYGMGLGVTATFRIWHIYPVTLSAGPHIVEIICHNDTLAAAMGCEIYDATASELQAATSYVDLGSKLIFSSKDYIGENLQIGSGGLGYTCPDGYSLATCESPVTCQKFITTPPVDCASTTTTTTSSSTTTTTTT